MSIAQWPEAERPREKLLSRGAQALTYAELLAIFLRTRVAGKSAVDLARDLLADLEGLKGLFGSDEERFAEPRAWAGPNTPNCRPCWHRAAATCEEEIKGRDLLTSPEATRAYFRAQLYPPDPRGLRLPVSRQPPPRNPLRRALSGHHRWCQRASARSPGAARGCRRHLRPQPPLGDHRADPSSRIGWRVLRSSHSLRCFPDREIDRGLLYPIVRELTTQEERTRLGARSRKL